MAESPSTLQYYSSDCKRFHDTDIFLYKGDYLHLSDGFYRIKKLISMRVDHSKDHALILTFDDGLYMKTLTVRMEEGKTDYSIIDLYMWLHKEFVKVEEAK